VTSASYLHLGSFLFNIITVAEREIPGMFFCILYIPYNIITVAEREIPAWCSTHDSGQPAGLVNALQRDAL
jgi:hypothetical protein